MMLERGPQGKIHAPAYRDGCYHGRVADCCALCVGRVALATTTSPLRYRIRAVQRNDDHELLGERVVVPYVDRASRSDELDYREGTISDVHVLSGNDPDLLTVKVDDDEYIHVDLSTGSKPTVDQRSD